MRDRVLRVLAAPLTALFGLGVELRLLLYRTGLLRRTRFSLPTIAVGNLSVGGAGKTPHTEHLVRTLAPYLPVGVLSRGYGRQTAGFRFVHASDSARDVGDEPLQIKRKFPTTPVAVAEDRVAGLSRLLQYAPSTKTVVLDDAFQHLAIEPALNLLLTEYDRPYWRDYLMPSGRLREWRSSADRADAIVVTKCPGKLDQAARNEIIRAADPRQEQRVFFSRYRYGVPWLLLDPRYRSELQADWEVLLVTAIARVDYLLDFLEPRVHRVHEMSFDDHHDFTEHDMGRMVRVFRELESTNKLILTTEKDAVRMQVHQDFLEKQRLPLFALPIEVEFLVEPDGRSFDDYVREQLLSFRA